MSRMQKTHKVVDTFFKSEEYRPVYFGTLDGCNDYCKHLNLTNNIYKVEPMTDEEKVSGIANDYI